MKFLNWLLNNPAPRLGMVSSENSENILEQDEKLENIIFNEVKEYMEAIQNSSNLLARLTPSLIFSPIIVGTLLTYSFLKSGGVSGKNGWNDGSVLKNPPSCTGPHTQPNGPSCK